MDSTHTEMIERATLHAVSPDAQAEIPGWILPFDSGTVGRAKSAVPLVHATPQTSVLHEIEAAYALRGLPVMLRIPVLPSFDAFRWLLGRQGYREETLTEVHTAPSAIVQAVCSVATAELLQTPESAWASVFLGAGFDPVDGASRVQKLGRASGSLFALIREQDRPVAAGAAAFSHGWASIHGMRTVQDRRGQGLASRVLGTLASAAVARGYDQIFLQVAAENTTARSLYHRFGFASAWSYSYWKRVGL